VSIIGCESRKVFQLVVGVLLAAVAYLFCPVSGEAKGLNLLLNGKAVHLNKAPGAEYNERNWGGGLQYDFNPMQQHWIPFVAGSVFRDSKSNPSYYAGGGVARRFELFPQSADLHLDVGAVAFLMVREDFRKGRPFLGVLPIVSFGSERVSVNATYVPKVDPKMVPILFFQLKIKVADF